MPAGQRRHAAARRDAPGPGYAVTMRWTRWLPRPTRAQAAHPWRGPACSLGLETGATSPRWRTNSPVAAHGEAMRRRSAPSLPSRRSRRAGSGTMPAMSKERTHAERLRSRDGYFAPESVIRRVGNTPLVPFLGGGPAVLLQVAHPLVAAGVAEHSAFRRNLWRRLVRTLRALYLITYGSRHEADAAGLAVQRVHEGVRGVTRTRLGRYPPGTAYAACDPELLLWVHATLVESSLAVYTRFVEPLTAREQERYYEEMTVVARLFGVPGSVIPPTLRAFREYWAEQLAGDTLTVTPPAREVAAAVLDAPLPGPLRLVVPAHRLSTAGLLPPRLREEYGLRWSPLHELALPLAARAFKVASAPLLSATARLGPPPSALAA